ncbi:MAG: hypothetical protein ABSC94_00640 [Polyangiaceae bacterium]|jgi:hypothetical protein
MPFPHSVFAGLDDEGSELACQGASGAALSSHPEGNPAVSYKAWAPVLGRWFADWRSAEDAAPNPVWFLIGNRARFVARP